LQNDVIIEILAAGSATTSGVAMFLLIFVVGALLGVLAGGAVCVRYLRHEIAADVGPQLRRLQLQLDNLEAAVNLALITRYAELSAGPLRAPTLPAPPANGGD
jgi:hypothetical protein